MKHIIELLQQEQGLFGKCIKILIMRTLFFILFFISFINSSAQYIRTPYCSCEIKGTKITNYLKENKVSLDAHYSENKINLKITNNTKDTIFIFKSYFDTDISTSNYVFRYNKKNNIINVSFVPLLPYLFTKYSDRIIFQDRIIKDHQVVYDFYRIPPFYEYSVNVPIINLNTQKEFIKDFDIRLLNKFEKIKRFKTIKVKKTNPTFILSIAYYDSVKTLCNVDAYYQEELKFNTAAKNFKIIQSLIE